MLAQIVTENGQKKIIPLTADAGAGNPVGTIIPMYKKSSPSGYLYCDGSTFDETKYPLLYAYLGSNVLPDYREAAIVGAEQNTTDTIADHDVYTQGQFKDDQLQNHGHSITDPGHSHSSNPNKVDATIMNGGSQTRFITWNEGGWGTYLNVKSNTTGITIGNPNSGSHGTVTRGKRKAVYFYIKATSGLSENAQDNVINTLNEERSYSTSEVNTGKKWIDGKPIYRKVIEINFSPNHTYTETVSADAGNSTYQVVNLSESVVVGSFGTRQPWYDSKSGNVPTTVYMSGGIVYFVTEHQAGKANIVCEYTKTTD